MTGTPEASAKAGCSIADIAAGMYAYTGILSALLQRGKTGKGSHVEISMLESMTEWMGFPLYYAFDGASPPPRAGAAHATIFPYGPFPAGDGGTVMLGLQNEREWVLFCRNVLLRPELSSDERFASNSLRVTNREILRELIHAEFATLTTDQVVQRLEAAQIANARVNTMQDVWQHPQLQARGRWTEVATPSGPIPALLPPASSSSYTPRMESIPGLGEHTETILRDLGRTPESIAQLKAEHVI